MKRELVHLGYALGSGEPVRVPLAHTFVAGQTQLSGKSTTLHALAVRSGRRSLAFVTKRGEKFQGRKIRPYLPRRSDHPIHWRMVETILASALGEKKLKYERLWLINASRGAKSLDDVAANVERLKSKLNKNDRRRDVYELIGEYLELVLPEMRQLDASDTLDLGPADGPADGNHPADGNQSVNVIDLIGVSEQLQAMVIRACLERINHHEENVLTVFPEAWEFAPRGRVTPASGEAIAMVRKGAVIGNLLLSDSQDIAGVDTVIRQQSSVWLLGVQREANELARNLKMIAAGVKRPKPSDMMNLKLGQFVACWEEHAIPTYVQPAWMSDEDARAIALGKLSIHEVAPPASSEMTANVPSAGPRPRYCGCGEPLSVCDAHPPYTFEPPATSSETTVADQDLGELELEDDDMDTESKQLLAQMATNMNSLVNELRGHGAQARGTIHAGGKKVHDTERREADHAEADEVGSNGFDASYQAIKRRLLAEEPAAIMQLITVRPEIVVQVERQTLNLDGTTVIGRVGRLLQRNFFANAVGFNSIRAELKRTGTDVNIKTLGSALKQLISAGFMTKEANGYQAVKGMSVREKEASK